MKRGRERGRVEYQGGGRKGSEKEKGRRELKSEGRIMAKRTGGT